MKLTGFLLCLAAISANSLPQSSQVSRSSARLINRINLRQSSWKASSDFLSSVPWSQIMVIANDTGATPKSRLLSMSKPLRVSSFMDVGEIPEEFDAREHWKSICPNIGKIQDQGICGSGWAVAPASAFTDRYCIATGGKHQEPLSAAHLLYCEEYMQSKCQGGIADILSWHHIVENGLPTGGSYGSNEGCEPSNIPPIFSEDTQEGSDECPSKCTNEAYKIPLKDDFRYGKELDAFWDDDVAIQEDILANGPSSVYLKVFVDMLFYRKGVYDISSDPDNFEIGGHSAKLIGWGTENGNDFWIVQNSFGEIFGDKGIIKIKRGSKSFQFVFSARPDVPKEM